MLSVRNPNTASYKEAVVAKETKGSKSSTSSHVTQEAPNQEILQILHRTQEELNKAKEKLTSLERRVNENERRTKTCKNSLDNYRQNTNRRFDESEEFQGNLSQQVSELHLRAHWNSFFIAQLQQVQRPTFNPMHGHYLPTNPNDQVDSTQEDT